MGTPSSSSLRADPRRMCKRSSSISTAPATSGAKTQGSSWPAERWQLDVVIRELSFHHAMSV